MSISRKNEFIATETFTNHIFFTFLRNAQCKWMLWPIDSRTIIPYKHELLVDIVRTVLLLLLTLVPAVAFFFVILTLFFL